jgi:hypothetical protein
MLLIPKKLDMSLCVISVNRTVQEINKSFESAFYLDYDCGKILCVKPDFDTTGVDLENVKVLRHGESMTEMVDFACKNSVTEWIYFIFAGTKLAKKIDTKNAMHVTSHKDILFPVINRRWNFVEANLNGLLLNKNFHEEVGDFGAGNDLMVTKLIWADKALQHGAKFKGLVAGGNNEY